MRYLPSLLALCAAALGPVLLPRVAAAHGFVGDRFFPPTIATDDPFAADELKFPIMSYIGAGAGQAEVDSYFEFDKEIFPHFALGVNDTYKYIKSPGNPADLGWDDVELTALYELWHNLEHEAIISIGTAFDIGASGAQAVGADHTSTLQPIFYYGKGFGDLPDSLSAVRPLAVTGTISQTFPFTGSDSNVLNWGFAIEYSLPYLQQNVQDIGLPRPFRDMIPLVEFALSTPENRDGLDVGPTAAQTTGTINPGVLWETHYFQLGVEANIPINSASGPHVGVTVQLEIFIDDIFPKIFGHPLFGGD